MKPISDESESLSTKPMSKERFGLIAYGVLRANLSEWAKGAIHELLDEVKRLERCNRQFQELFDKIESLLRD